MRGDEVMAMLKRFLKQYEDLVWYAQQDKTDLSHPDRARIEKIRKEYPLASFAVSGSASEWNHGFNCGCLAEARRVLALLDEPGAATNEQAVAVSRLSDQLGTYIGTEAVGVEAPKKAPRAIPQEDWETLPPATRERIARDCGYRERKWLSDGLSKDKGESSCLEMK